jgi:hypothetical protein
MNVDFAQVKTSGKEPNLRIVSSHGLNSFSLTLPTDAVVSHFSFADADEDKSNDWVSTAGRGRLTWTGSERNELTWGSLFRFSFESNQSPAPTNVHLGVEGQASHGSPEAKIFARKGKAQP